MQGRKITLSVILLLFTATFAFGQSEVLKVVVNNLAFYKQNKDIKYLNSAKKSIDSLTSTHKDSLNLERNVYKAVVYTSILYIDSLNKSAQPADFLDKTTKLVDALSADKKIYKYAGEMSFAKRSLADVYIRRGFEQLRISDYSAAKLSFQKAHDYVPDFKPLNANIAYINSRMGNLQEAAKYYDKLVNSDSLRVEYVESASNIYKAVGDTDKALQIIKKGRRVLPNDKYLLLDEADIYNNKKDYHALESLIPALLDGNPNNADVVFVAANCYDQLDKYEQAESLYLKAIELNSSAVSPVFNLALLYLKESVHKKGENSKRYLTMAIQWLERANDMMPNNLKSLQLLQTAYSKAGKQQQAENISNKIKQLTD